MALSDYWYATVDAIKAGRDAFTESLHIPLTATQQQQQDRIDSAPQLTPALDTERAKLHFDITPGQMVEYYTREMAKGLTPEQITTEFNQAHSDYMTAQDKLDAKLDRPTYRDEMAFVQIGERLADGRIHTEPEIKSDAEFDRLLDKMMGPKVEPVSRIGHMADKHWQGICSMATNKRLPEPNQDEVIRKQAAAVVATGERPPLKPEDTLHR